MKRKPLWSLWLLVIIAPIAVFVGVNYWKSLPPPLAPQDAQTARLAATGTPLIGNMQLAEMQGKSNLYGAFITLCNPTREKLSVDFVVESGSSECFKYPKSGSPTYRDGRSFMGCFIGNGAMQFGIIEIKKIRKKPIILKLRWKHGQVSGVKKVVITPQMNSQAVNQGAK